MVKAAARVRYEPGPAFEEVKEEAMLDISPTDSTEFWLIQWPKDQIDVLDFHGKELSLKLHSDGNLGSLESSSGKSYELVSFAAQKPDATVFLPSGSETKPVGKISRRVSLVHYPKPEELAKPSFGSLTLSSKKSAGSKKTMSRFTSASKNRSSQGSALSLGQRSASRHPNTRGRERMKAAWGTQMYQARPRKDLRLEARGATWPQRCHNRHQKNHRRRGRRLRSWSSTVVVSPWQEINSP